MSSPRTVPCIRSCRPRVRAQRVEPGTAVDVLTSRCRIRIHRKPSSGIAHRRTRRVAKSLARRAHAHIERPIVERANAVLRALRLTCRPPMPAPTTSYSQRAKAGSTEPRRSCVRSCACGQEALVRRAETSITTERRSEMIRRSAHTQTARSCRSPGSRHPSSSCRRAYHVAVDRFRAPASQVP
jgi:hypothetical protein